MVDWLRLTARHWFLLPPALLLLAVAIFLLLAIQESPPTPGVPRPLNRWSEPIRRPPSSASALVRARLRGPFSHRSSAEVPGDRPRPTIGPDSDNEP